MVRNMILAWVSFSEAVTASGTFVAAGFKHINDDQFAVFMMSGGQEYLSDPFANTKYTSQIFIVSAATVNVVYEEKKSACNDEKESCYLQHIKRFQLIRDVYGKYKLLNLKNSVSQSAVPLERSFVISGPRNSFYRAYCVPLVEKGGVRCPCYTSQKWPLCVPDLRTGLLFGWYDIEGPPIRMYAVYCNKFTWADERIDIKDSDPYHRVNYCISKNRIYHQVQLWNTNWNLRSNVCQPLGSINSQSPWPSMQINSEFTMTTVSYLFSKRCLICVKVAVPISFYVSVCVCNCGGLSKRVRVTLSRCIFIAFAWVLICWLDGSVVGFFETSVLLFTTFICSILTMVAGNKTPVAVAPVVGAPVAANEILLHQPGLLRQEIATLRQQDQVRGIQMRDLVDDNQMLRRQVRELVYDNMMLRQQVEQLRQQVQRLEMGVPANQHHESMIIGALVVALLAIIIAILVNVYLT